MVKCEECKLNLSCKTKIGVIIKSCGRFSPLRLNTENEQCKSSKNPSPEKYKVISTHVPFDKEERENEKKKRKIIHDIETGRGGPDIAGLKRMHGFGYRSSLAENAKRKLSNG